ncbi:WD repeat-containing protein 61 [Calocera viscosa TUFC12733]|uniref:WD repeat-containing protein 61 n=1 Tax=Calocera viscosa (strain TUFC12733) TaxID=1330018 RepID=A0A167QUL9_CALVF|nr:WD repeat-containing protein 61 [Calocera viscosa TUFC12733]
MSQQFIGILQSDEKDKHSEPVWGVKWTSDDKTISISADGSFVVWKPDSAQVLCRPPPDTVALVSLSCPGKNFALYNSMVGVTRLINLSSGAIAGEKSEKEEEMDSAWSVSLHPNESTYAAVGQDGTINFYSASPDTFGQHVMATTPVPDVFGMCVSYSPDGKRVAMSNRDGEIFVCDSETGDIISTYFSHAACVRTLSWSKDSDELLSGSDDQRLVLHDLRGHRGGIVTTFEGPQGHNSWVLSADLSSDGKLIASGSADKTLKVWDLETRKCVSTTQGTGEVWSVSWKPSGGQLVTGETDGNVRWWRSASSG